MNGHTALITILFLRCVLCRGTFWHITDFHWDNFYSQNGNDSMSICPSSYGRPIANAGPLGAYKCDSPWTLIQSSIDAMKLLHPDPDFILWTGDDTLHTNQQDKYLGKNEVVDIIRVISETIKEVFPRTPVFPALGNHDYHPKSQIPPGGSEILTAIANIWKRLWLSDDAYASFSQDGFYKDFLPGSKTHVIMVLNSNFWYSSNKAVNGSGDPGMQFHWMEQTLRDAASKSHKVFIAGHVPPGYFEMVSNYHKRWFYQAYNERFLTIIRENKDVIAGMFFGHHHTDTFRIIKDIDENVVQSLLISPGVTPWATTLGGVVNGSNNPGIRLVDYDKDLMKIKDFTQYYLDLETANKQNQSDTARLWKKEYTATTKYGIPDITSTSMGRLAISMRKSCEHSDTKCSKTFEDYYRMNSVSYKTDRCNVTCQMFHICAITEIDTAGYESCMQYWGSHGIRADPYWISTLLIITLSYFAGLFGVYIS